MFGGLAARLVATRRRRSPGDLGPDAAGATYADGVLTIPTATVDMVPDLVRAVVATGAPVYEVGVVRQSLEEAFVDLVGHHPADPPATAADPAVAARRGGSVNGSARSGDSGQDGGTAPTPPSGRASAPDRWC